MTSSGGSATLRRGVLLAVVVAVVSACVPGEPVRISAVRIEDDQLRYLLGADCEGVTTVTVDLMDDKGEQLKAVDSWTVSSVNDSGAVLSGLTAGATPNGFTETDALQRSPSDVDVVLISLDSPDSGSRSSADMSTVLAGATEHPGEWYVENEGWKTEQEFQALIDPDDDVYPGCPP